MWQAENTAPPQDVQTWIPRTHKYVSHRKRHFAGVAEVKDFEILDYPEWTPCNHKSINIDRKARERQKKDKGCEGDSTCHCKLGRWNEEGRNQGMQMTFRSWAWSLADNQQGNTDLILTATREWILPTSYGQGNSSSPKASSWGGRLWADTDFSPANHCWTSDVCDLR